MSLIDQMNDLVAVEAPDDEHVAGSLTVITHKMHEATLCLITYLRDTVLHIINIHSIPYNDKCYIA